MRISFIIILLLHFCWHFIDNWYQRTFFDIITGRPASLIVIEFKIILLDNFKSYYRIIIFYCESSYCNKLQNRVKNLFNIIYYYFLLNRYTTIGYFYFCKFLKNIWCNIFMNKAKNYVNVCTSTIFQINILIKEF